MAGQHFSGNFLRQAHGRRCAVRGSGGVIGSGLTIQRAQSARGRRDQPADVVDNFQQFGVTQNDQRHRVVAVEIGVENEIGLITEAGQQIAPSGQHS